MLTERNLIYFDPFYFKNGNACKPKYCVVLKVDSNKSVLASLPTRKDSIPVANSGVNGCVNMPNINLNCFVCQEDYEVLETSVDGDDYLTFPTLTHLYGHQLDVYEESYFDIYSKEGIDYEIIGKIRQDVYDEMIKCFKGGASVKRKFRKIL
jgi:hypothetical protein